MSALEGSKYQEFMEDNNGKSWYNNIPKKPVLNLADLPEDKTLKEIESFLKLFNHSGWITEAYIDEPIVQNKQLEDLITQIRDSFNGSVEVYTKGSCIKFCMILKTVFPRGVILYNSDHAIFELNNRFYDITGEVVKLDSHIPIEQYGILKCYELMNLKYSI